LFVQISAEPHFGTVQAWNGEGGVAKASDARRALELWDLTQWGGRFLAAKLKLDAYCGGALWARATSKHEPELYQPRAPAAGEDTKVLDAVRAHPEYKALQREYQRVTGKREPWDLDAARSITLFDHDKRATYVEVVLSATLDDGCASEFDPDLWMLLEYRGDAYHVVSAPMDAQGWFGSSTEFDHMELQSMLRAVETRRPLFRATNTGITSLVLPDGSRPEGPARLVVGGRDRAVGGVLVVDVPLVPLDSAGLTPYVRWGDWPGWASLAGALLLLLRRRPRVP
jgi:hypothetical protein